MSHYALPKTVNHAFLSELKECNSNLWEDVNLLGAYTAEPFCGDWIEQNGGRLLRKLRQELGAQFALEETFGYNDVPFGEPDPMVDAAIDQHLTIILKCVALSEQFDDLEYSGTLANELFSMWHNLRELYQTIVAHESLEREILARSWQRTDNGAPRIIASR